MNLLFAAIIVAATAVSQPPSLQEMLDRAVASGQEKIALPAGRINVQGSLRVNHADGLVIEGGGTTIVFSDHRGTGWSFNSCRNVTLRGFTIDYDPLPFVQGRITERSDDGAQFRFTVCDGYPGLRRSDVERYRQAYVFESDERRWKPWVPDLYPRQVEIIDERQGRLLMGRGPACHELIEPGDRIVLTIRSGGAIRMNDCENVRVEDVTFWAAPGPAYLGRYMRGDNYYRYTIAPGPPPPGATQPRLISTCADGLNIAFATKGPTIEGCRFSFMGDDSVNLHGVTLAVVERLSPTELLVAWPYSPERLATVMPHGAMVRRMRAGNFEVLGTATLASFSPTGQRTAEHLEAIRRVWPRGEGGSIFRLSLKEPLHADPGDFLDLPANNAPGFAIRDCVFEDHRARGLRIMASHGVIERNTFRRIKMNAISIGAEYGFWREAGWTEDIAIRGNTIEDIGRDAGMLRRDAYVLGAIGVFVRPDPEPRLPLWSGNRGIVIADNAIRDCAAAGIFVSAAKEVQIRGNRLEHCLYRPGDSAGLDMGLDVREPIDVRHAVDVVVDGNEIEAAGREPGRERE